MGVKKTKGIPWENQKHWKESGSNYLVFVEGYLTIHHMERNLVECAKRKRMKLEDVKVLAKKYCWELRASEYDASLGVKRLSEFESMKHKELEVFLRQINQINTGILAASARTLALVNAGLEDLKKNKVVLSEKNIPRYMQTAVSCSKASVEMMSESQGILEILSHIEKITK